MTEFDDDGPDLPPFRAFSVEDYRRLSRYDEAIRLLREASDERPPFLLYAKTIPAFLASEPKS